ncbi:MAG: hypothetical protein ACK5BY_01295 [Limnohabitans sp.]|jgi:hypothetical protein|uniref:hypothetical protein n=1 Tax=Limnohabitans sp. TaxID=1907725 RepID=UPI00391DF21A
MSWGLFPWRWFAAAVLVLSIFAAGFMAGQRRIERAWTVERLQQQAVVLQQSLHVAQVHTQQERINQQILTDYENKKSLLARRGPVLRDSAHSLCISAPGVTSPVPTIAEPAASTDASAAHAVPDPPGDATMISCEQLARDATDTTLMVMAWQRWYAEQAQVQSHTSELAIPP